MNMKQLTIRIDDSTEVRIDLTGFALKTGEA